MSVSIHDLRGLKCPQPTLKMTMLYITLPKGSIMEVLADCPTFEDDLKGWIQRTKKTLLWVRSEGDHQKCQIQL